MESQGKFLRLAVIGAGLLAGVGATLWASAGTPEGIITDGVRVAGMDWSGKSTAAARAELEAWRKTRLQEPLPLALSPETRPRLRWTPTRAQLGADIDIETTLREASEVGRQDGFLKRLLRRFSGPERVEIEPRWTFDADRLERYLQKQVAPRVRREERNARLLVQKSGFHIVPERLGTALDLNAAAQAVTERLTTAAAEPVTLPLRIVKPHITTADLQEIRSEMAVFRTHYAERGNRRRNIEVACSRINGTVLKPGDIFSYNETVGPRDAESGFRLAPVIMQGRMRPGMGGGICQVSSTLYNAVLLADLKIVRRSHHAFPVHYLPAGRDATVVYGSIDFQFQNNTNHPIAIAASGSGGQVVMRILGQRVPGREVKIERTNLSSWGAGVQTVRDPSLAAGRRRIVEKGHAGHRVTVWRVVKINGEPIKREMISRDYYRAFPAIVAVGTGALTRKPAVTAPARAAAPTPEIQPAAETSAPADTPQP